VADGSHELTNIKNELNHIDTESTEENAGPGCDVNNRRWLTVVLVCLLALTSGIVLYRTAHSASNLRITPDEIEYALGGHRIAEAGRFEILVDGHWRPSRYPPWFSLLVIAPTYLLLGMDPGNAIYPVTVFGIAGVVIAFFIGRRISGLWGGVLAGLGVLALPYYRLMGRIVMTDVPSACLALILCLFFMHWRSRASCASLFQIFLAGVVGALAGSLRVTNAALILPFLLLSRHNKYSGTVSRAILLFAPLAILAILQLRYNDSVFGLPWRNGYHYWAPVPYDYFHLTFQPGYLLVGLAKMIKRPDELIPVVVPLGILVAWIFWRQRHRTEQDNAVAAQCGLQYLLVGATPIVLFYSVYFFQSLRFLLPVMAVMAAICGGLAGFCLRRFTWPWVLSLAVLALVVVLSVRLSSPPNEPPFARMTCDDINQLTPDDAIIIASIPPSYIEYMVCRHSNRRIIPISRKVAYANSLIAQRKVISPEPAPRDWEDARCEGIRNGGSQEAVALVAEDNLDWVAGEIRAGRPVYITPTYLGDENRPVADQIDRRFHLKKVHEGLYKLRLRE
jgi:hypothetical protein